MPFIPPAGFAGLAQQTPAVQALYRGKRRNGKRRTSRKKKAVAAAPRRRKAARGNRFTKGSAAAKAHMAKLRKMRKK